MLVARRQVYELPVGCKPKQEALQRLSILCSIMLCFCNAVSLRALCAFCEVPQRV